jgi:hypothetical protein
MTDLVDRLSRAQPVEVALRPHRTVAALKAALDRGYVHVRFTETRGGTELGIPVDWRATDVSAVDWDRESGTLTIAGVLTLDFVKIRCTARLDLPSLAGEGHVERLDTP